MSSLLWESLESQLHPWLYEALVSLGYPTMTPVQASTIPLFSKNKDVIVESVTGSGKTLSFVIPVLQHVSNRLYGHVTDTEAPDLVKKGHMLAVVISPTRELASQTKAVFDRVLAFLPELKQKINTQLVVGSLASVREDIDTLTTGRSHILVATPGRLFDMLKSLKVYTSSVEIAVLDEADKLLDLSFENDVIAILKMLPNQRRTGLYSATLSSAGSRVFNTGLNNPVRIAVQSKSASKAAPSSLTIQYAFVEAEKKITSFLHLAHNYRFKKCIVYLPTCTGVKHFYNLLKELTPEDKIKFHSLHGQLTTNARLKTLQSFTDGDALETKHVLMTTDVAARGIDIPDVDLVVQLDPPTDPDVFVHRCGRTGRANKAGRAIVMLQHESNEEDFVGLMEVKKVDMTALELPFDEKFHAEFQEKTKQFMLEDRARHELAVKSYVGFVRYYHKHIASSIFRMLALDYLGVAKMYGLLRLPKMPETRYIAKESMPENGWLIKEDFDMDKYAYADEAKEKARLENLEAEKAQKINDAKARKLLKKKNEAWSVKMDTKESKTVRREKNKRKRDAIEKQIMDEPSEDEETQVDWKDMIRQNKKPKNVSGMQGSFDDL